MSRAGSRVSSAASGTPSMARKNQIANGKAAQMPATPKGRNALEPADPSGGMLVRFAGSNWGTIPTTKTTRPTTASAVIAKITLSASPTPKRWMPTKTP